MRRRIEIPTPVDVLIDPVVQLAAICPICALAALRPEAALAALAPGLVLFNPAVNPQAALLTLSGSLRAVERAAERAGPVGGRTHREESPASWDGHVLSRTGAARFRG